MDNGIKIEGLQERRPCSTTSARERRMTASLRCIVQKAKAKLRELGVDLCNESIGIHGF
jgi:hypothetical protein